MEEKPDMLKRVNEELDEAESTPEERTILLKAILEAILDLRDAVLIAGRIVPVEDDPVNEILTQITAGLAVEARKD